MDIEGEFTGIKKLHLVFKTHLDLGFTGLSKDVARSYFENYIPKAIALAQEVNANGRRSFVWTTGSWLLYEYLENASKEGRKSLEDAIARGNIVWHGLPFTTHSELMDRSLFEFGLSLSKSLDARFGRNTIAAKMTDVPGHTRAIVPLLLENGIRFLHIGVNPASSAPCVPDAFRWQEPESGAEVNVVYDKEGYGGGTVVKGLDEALFFGHSGDNCGPQSSEEILALHETLKAHFPGAEIEASTIDAFATSLEKISQTLPVVSQEIGDTWIHGVGSDPKKVSEFKELCRYRNEILAARPWVAGSLAFRRFSRKLLTIPEHTWGRDIKRRGPNGLFVEPTYERKAFETKRELGEYDDMEASWLEQREYISQAVAALEGTGYQTEAKRRLELLHPIFPSKEGLEKLNPEDVFETEFFKLRFDAKTGAATSLTLREGSRNFAGDGLFTPSFQTFGSESYERFVMAYNPRVEKNAAWAIPDFGKPGLEKTLKRGEAWSPSLTGLYKTETGGFLAFLKFPTEAVERFGCPAKWAVSLEFEKDAPAIRAQVNWAFKCASRIPCAAWLHFSLAGFNAKGIKLLKLGSAISPLDVVKNGNSALHAVEKLAGEEFELTPLDSPLVAPGETSLAAFDGAKKADLARGLFFNLYNNVWGTNFPLWTEEDAAFRFTLKFR